MEKYPTRPRLRGFFHSASDLLLRLTSDVEIAGLEHVPQTGACLLATNHLASLDLPLIYRYISRLDLTAFAAKKYHPYWPARVIFNWLNCIWVDRENVDRQALRRAQDLLNAGWMVGIAVEGTRSTTQALLPGKPGAAYLATRLQVPILPTALSGTDGWLGRLRRRERLSLTLRFGQPFMLPTPEGRIQEHDLERYTDAIMCRIAALLPPEYRGVYADHPLLRELAESVPASRT